MIKKPLLLALEIAGHLAYMVIIPLFIFGGAGLLIDRQLDTLPTYLLIGVGLAFISTMLWLKKRLVTIIKSMTD